MEFQESFLNAAPPKKSPAIKPKPATKPKHWHLYVDGASRGNPGEAGAGIYLECDKKAVKSSAIYLGKRTNNQAEYLALALGIYIFHRELEKNRNHGDTLTITSDSELLIKQMRGEYKIKEPTLKLLSTLVHELIGEQYVRFTHVLREHNTKADEQANIAIDTKGAMPAGFKKLLAQHNIPL